MVHNRFEVLDEGKIKYLPERIMSKTNFDPKVLRMMEDEWTRYQPLIYKNDFTREKVDLSEVPEFFLKHHRDVFAILNNQEFVYKKFIEWKNIPPFVPFMTLNISPNWSKMNGKPEPWKQDMLVELIERFAKQNDRFRQCDYVLECGSKGDHLHAHLVLLLNPKFEKTVITQQRKGNLARSVRKLWSDICDKHLKDSHHEVMRGILEGKFALQFSLLRKPEFLEDKLSYLVEELKPEDHKNSYKLNIFDTIVITSKV